MKHDSTKATRGRNIAICFALAAMALLGGGCAGGGAVTLADWRHSVERYVAEAGHGDPTALREVTWPESRRTFSAIGTDDPKISQDAQGLLLAYRQINGRPWFIFIVGIVDKQVVQDIRLTALDMQGGKTVWRTGDANAAALQAYRAYNERLWKQRFPGRTAAPAQYTTFPQEADAFTIQVEGGQVIAVHPPSGARWELAVDSSATKHPKPAP